MMLQMTPGGIYAPEYHERLIIPVSPPRERQRQQEQEIIRDIRPLRCPGLIPVAYREYQELMPTAIITHRRMGPYSPLASLTDARFFYKFESTSWLDSTSGGNNLTPHNTPTCVAGKIGNCANFVEASSQYLSCAYNAAFNLSGTEGCFITSWIYLAATPATFSRPWKKTSTINDWYITYQFGALSFYCARADGTGVGPATYSGGSLSTQTWYFVVCKVSTAAQLQYISVNNAAFDTGQACVGGIGNVASGELDIGRDDATNGHYFGGRVDSFGGWNRLPTTAEITALYNGGTGADPF